MSVVKKYSHPKTAYGCNWSPHNMNLLVTGCQDGLVRIFDVSSTASSPILLLSGYHFVGVILLLLGHASRVFNTVWSPLVPKVLASGSDDKTLRVWTLQERGPAKVKELKGHVSNVRAIVWSECLPWLLLSGSWDATIRVWDIRSESCVRVLEDHHADVYGLCTHSMRPFIFASSSRDTTLRYVILLFPVDHLRLWSMQDEWLVSKVRLRALWGRAKWARTGNMLERRVINYRSF